MGGHDVNNDTPAGDHEHPACDPYPGEAGRAVRNLMLEGQRPVEEAGSLQAPPPNLPEADCVPASSFTTRACASSLAS